MKLLSTLFAISVITLNALPASADTLSFPNDKEPMFKISIPSGWNPERDEDDIMKALSPDEKIYLTIWEPDENYGEKELQAEFNDLLKDHAKDIKIDPESKEAHPGGLDGRLYRGEAVATDDNHPIQFYGLFVKTPKKMAVVYIEADSDAPEAESTELQKILSSLTPEGASVAPAAVEAPAEGKLLRAAIALDQHTRPTDTFTSDAPKLYGFYIGDALKAGDKLRGVWIAEDVGAAAAANTKIDEATLVATSATDQGAFSLSKPTNGWPIGSYRLDIYVNDKLAESVKFKITK